MLTLDEQTRIHEAIAVQMLSNRKIDASDADSILMHAIAGKSPQSLAMLAKSVLMTDSRTLEMLAEHLTLLPLFRTDRLIFPENPSVSVTLRLAQFKLAAAAREGKNLSDIAAALFDETSAVPAGEMRRAFEAAALTTVLNTMGIANYLDNWVELLHRFKAIVESDNLMQNLWANIDGAIDPAGPNLYGVLFGIGSTGLASVERLEHIINELDKIDEGERALWLTPIEKSFSDYSVFINTPWVSQQRGEAFNPAESALRYQRIADKVQNWGIRLLTIQCWVAQAVILDEYENDMEKALAVLDNAIAAFGADPILSRARSKIFWRHDQHAMALDILRGIADKVGGDNSVERAFALREAAISAAKCDEWPLAEKWFLEAQRAAEHCQADGMRVMAIGLCADAAVATLETGSVGQAIERLAEALDRLAGINPDASLRAAYCHRVIRHAVLWARSRIQETDVKIDGEPIAMQAGACSNPDPTPAIRSLPLGPMDIAWYMLAEAETVAGLDVGITTRLSNRLTCGPIPVMECMLRARSIQMDIDYLDAGRFSTHLMPYVEATTFMANEHDRLRSTFDPLAPERGQVPALNKNAPFGHVAEQTAIDAILSFGIRAALLSQPNAMLELEAALDGKFASNFPGREVFETWKGNQTVLLGQLDQAVMNILKTLFRKEHIEPSEFWMAGLRLFEKINQSNFRQPLTPCLAAWQRAGWKRIITAETFRLSRPVLTVPAIQVVLAIPSDDRSFIAKLLLASSEAVGSPLGISYRDSLKSMADEAPA